MLYITIPAIEGYDEAKNEFVTLAEEQTLELEHSLYSVSKWESKWHKSFLAKVEKTPEETLDYIKCMTLTPNVDPSVYNRITEANVEDITEYIRAPMTATSFNDRNAKKPSREVITAEIIYYWMITAQIPMECQYWHLNRLITLVRVCSIKNSPPKKYSASELRSQYAAINAANRQKFNSKG